MIRSIIINNIGVLSLLLGVLLMGLSCRDATPPPVQGIPRLALRLDHVDLSKQEIVFEVTITNTGPESLTIPHLQEGTIEDVGQWGGFFLDVRDSNDESFCIPPTRSPTLSRKDLITLAPGGSVSVTVNLATARMRDQAGPDRQDRVLAQEPGSYTAIAYMHIGRDNLPIEIKHRVWAGLQKSKPVRFTIPSE